ncbi:undecaprenyl pyrophosphate synthetase [Breoghania corrubedonensis]|uniref:Isoprenyl transferase n=1 Tax=Breoghania corrubedonensis TaxID=665038 RepID=A0A2T5VBM3_9HYPH|nr:isoprenyl transferase [Breoghania corrubedonensis]PTW61140.1 undecaprenyl pyrophosphate synthetase [Breoghania corrubedonensis]
MTFTADASDLTARRPSIDGCVPRHVAIIMDGNGRWAKARGLPRTEGHRRGAEVIRRIVRRSIETGVEILTLFSFSSENWSRPATEVSYLLGLLRRFVRTDLANLHENGVRVRVIGERDGLASDIRALLEEAERLTCDNTALTLVVAFNYGSRQELVDAARKLAEDVAAGRLDSREIDSDAIAERLYTRDIPDPDLIIRTSGEQRLSNFLLWQAAYSEFYFEPALWPDYDKDAFDRALASYAKRDRRFGRVSSQAAT